VTLSIPYTVSKIFTFLFSGVGMSPFGGINLKITPALSPNFVAILGARLSI